MAHGLQTVWVVVHVHGCEGDRVRVFIRRPRGSRLDCVKDVLEGLKRGESTAADDALSCWNLYSDDVVSLSTVCSADALKMW